MKIHALLAAAAMIAAASTAHAQDAATTEAKACLAEVQAIDADRVGAAGPGDVNRGMQAAQEEEARRLQAVARQQAEEGDASACRQTLATLEELVAANRQQLPTQQDLATGQPGSPSLEEALEDE